MSYSQLFTNIFSTILPTLVVVIAACVLLAKQGKYAGIFITGLFIILLGGLLAVPASNYMWQNHQEIMSKSHLATTIIVFVFGVINSIGLGMCVYAFYKRGKSA